MIDNGLMRPWPQDLLDALERFVQGDIVEAPPFTFLGLRAMPLWRRESSGGDDGERESSSRAVGQGGDFETVAVDPSERPQLGIITTNTCDLCEVGDPEQPWFQLSPVYKLESDASTLKQYLFQLDPPELPPANWVADLRLEVAVEKSYLAGTAPIKSFRTEEGYLELGRELGRRRDRAALADRLVDAVAGSLRKRKSNNRGFRKVFDNVQSVRLAIPRGERLAPIEARVHVVTRGPINEPDRERFETWWDQARQECEQAGIILLENAYHDGGVMDVELYAMLIDLNIR